MARVSWLPASLDMDCGPACLAMVLAYHGMDSSVDAMRERLGTGRDGTSGLDLVRVARELGLDSRGYRVVEADALGAVSLPLIAHYRSGHFVVVERVRPGRDIGVVDPVRGRHNLSTEEFQQLFSGTIVTFARGEKFVPSRDRSLRRFLAGTVRGEWRLVLLLVAVSLALQATAFAVPALVAFVVDRVIPTGSISFLTIAIAGVPVFLAAYAFAAWVRGKAMSVLVARVSRDWLDRLYRHILELPLSYFQGRPVNDLVIRVQGVDLVLDEMIDQVVAGALDTLLAVAALVALLATYPEMSGLVVAAIVVQGGVSWAARRQSVDAFVRDLIAHSRLYTFTAETLGGIADVKMIGPDRLAPAWKRLLDERVEAGADRRRRSALWNGVLSAAQAGGPLVVLIAGAQMAMEGHATIGAVIGFYTLAGVCLAPVAGLAMSAYHLRSMKEYVRRAYELLEHEPEPATNEDATRVHARINGEIALQGVGYRYSAQSEPVVSDVELELAAGETVVIVGRTGSGKSTLAKVIATLYQPTTGEVRIDGVPVSLYDRSGLRTQFGVVFQEDALIPGSVLDNITFGREIAVDEVYAALELAQLLDEVRRMPLALATPVGSRGLHLSGGQRQRLCMARALVHKPSILVLDEATSAIDRLTERRVYDKLLALPCTKVLVTHRLYVAESADRVVVLDRGRIAEQGTHHELAGGSGLYARMHGARRLSRA